MNKETQKQIMISVALWDLFDESLSLIDERGLKHRMKFLFKGLSNKSSLLRKELERNGVINQEEDDYEKVKDELTELVFNNLNKIE
jgi:hypothetical protein